MMSSFSLTPPHSLSPAPVPAGMYLPQFEHDACGVGLLCHVGNVSSHTLIQEGIRCLNNLNHRGAVGAEKNSGDGAGILFKVPHTFLQSVMDQQGVSLPEAGTYGVAQLFLPRRPAARAALKAFIAHTAKELKLPLLGWRSVPTDNTSLGAAARFSEPVIEQLFIGRPQALASAPPAALVFERKLFSFRRYLKLGAAKLKNLDMAEKGLFIVISCSARTIVYKGQLIPYQLKAYFKDLNDSRIASPYIIFHSRFSTNTFPSWPLAHPYRYLAHNGEINTLRGNINWMRSREADFASKYFTRKELKAILPLIDHTASDTACLDNALELLLLNGYSLPHALMVLIPEAWENDVNSSPAHRACFEYHAAFCEPWDGPAALCVTDGLRYVGGMLDRNGLRPARYTLYHDELLVIGSETGLLQRPPDTVRENGRIEPGKLLMVDLEAKRVLGDAELKTTVSASAPYQTWIKKKISLSKLSPPPLRRRLSEERMLKQQRAFGYTEEELRVLLVPMFIRGEEATGSMGTDTPLAVLSHQSHNLFNYFYQLFAQVTNPPIDPIRENSFMSLLTFLGPQRNLLRPGPDHACVIELQHPILNERQLEKLRGMDKADFQATTLPMLFTCPAANPNNINNANNGNNDNNSRHGKALSQALLRLCRNAEEAIDNDYKIIILSDRNMDSAHAAIPSLLAVSAVHQHLVRCGKRTQASLVVESGEVREVHHFAMLLGYGANAICPYLAFASLGIIRKQNITSSEFSQSPASIPPQTAENNYIRAVCKGLLKIISKMGISTIRSYIGSQLFEAVGLANELVDTHFCGTVSRMGGISFAELEQETLNRHRQAYAQPPTEGKPKKEFTLELGGQYGWRQRGEGHLFAPMVIHKLQQAVRNASYKDYQVYAELINNQQQQHFTLRGLLDFNTKGRKAIPLHEVEAEASILKRFVTGAMSYGSISWEAHTTLALAMNKIGGKSNTGEGGEDPIRYQPLPTGDSMRSAIKQVASGRFGVTSHYLTNADELQIKIAQGAKPGEGGQLPGHKVDAIIARVRHSTAGVGLISPPPHHDIYSIEDLAQLIYDLKCANQRARISVKLVSATGVGTIAAGVVKGYADHVVIAGFDGGTGASPLTSIKHAGLPWELGLTETHHTLVQNRLRSRMTLQVDGQLRTGRDIAIATLLGAEEWGIATAALVAMGCILMRKCHLNTCPVGIATQRSELRKLFNGEAEHVVMFFKFLTQELRGIMASLGLRTINEMVGHAELLKQRPSLHWKAHSLDWSKLLHVPKAAIAASAVPATSYCSTTQANIVKHSSDWTFIEQLKPMLTKPPRALLTGQKVFHFTKIIKNTERSFGTLLSHHLTAVLDGQTLPPRSIQFSLTGSAGQSFAAFSICGIEYTLTGEANDYFCKGLSGSTVIMKHPKNVSFNAADNMIIGNVAFYGATSGTAYINGRAGERFCVRNSGAHVVVEGIGAHGCEYMTGGSVVILGSIGKNFAAGMSGGIAYIYAAAKAAARANTVQLINRALVNIETPTPAELRQLRQTIVHHQTLTGSTRAHEILAGGIQTLKQFMKIMPIDYKRALQQAAAVKQRNSKQAGKLKLPTSDAPRRSVAIPS